MHKKDVAELLDSGAIGWDAKVGALTRPDLETRMSTLYWFCTAPQ